MKELITEYGYLAIVVGTFFEGEITILLGVLAAQSGLLTLPGVFLAASVGTLTADQFFFQLGRRRGYALLSRHRKWRRGAARVRQIIRRYHTGVILGFRFLYGLRTVTPFVLGMSKVPPWRFTLLDLTGTFIWAGSVTLLGMTFGVLARRYLATVQHAQLLVLVAILIIIVLGGISMHLYRRTRG